LQMFAIMIVDSLLADNGSQGIFAVRESRHAIIHDERSKDD